MLYYSKATADLQNVVLIAVNLDPRFPRNDIEAPGCGASYAAAVAATDLMITIHLAGKRQHIRLDPAVLPLRSGGSDLHGNRMMGKASFR